MLLIIPGDVWLFEAPQVGDAEDAEVLSVNGVVEPRPLDVLCRFVGIDCWVNAGLVCLLGGMGLLRYGLLQLLWTTKT